MMSSGSKFEVAIELESVKASEETALQLSCKCTCVLFLLLLFFFSIDLAICSVLLFCAVALLAAFSYFFLRLCSRSQCWSRAYCRYRRPQCSTSLSFSLISVGCFLPCFFFALSLLVMLVPLETDECGTVSSDRFKVSGSYKFVGSDNIGN